MTETIIDYRFKSFAELLHKFAPLPREFNLLVKFCNEEAKFMVKETILLAKLKAEIGMHWRIPKNVAITYFGSSELECDLTLFACYLCENYEAEVEVIGPC